jgi:hypothetical protein
MPAANARGPAGDPVARDPGHLADTELAEERLGLDGGCASVAAAKDDGPGQPVMGGIERGPDGLPELARLVEPASRDRRVVVDGGEDLEGLGDPVAVELASCRRKRQAREPRGGLPVTGGEHGLGRADIAGRHVLAALQQPLGAADQLGRGHRVVRSDRRCDSTRASMRVRSPCDSAAGSAAWR